jgi:hypothetical protein
MLTRRGSGCYSLYVKNMLCRFAAAAVVSVCAVSVPAFADQPEPGGKPTAVVVRVTGGFHPENRWLWYDGDGTARFDGIYAQREGQFRSRVDFATVRKILDEAELCSSEPTLVRPAAMDVRQFFVTVRCGDTWRGYTTFDVAYPLTNDRVRKAARELERVASALSWEPSDEHVAAPGFPPRPRAVTPKRTPAPE